MSAICGILRFDGDDVPPRAVDRMAQAMKHRGGDGIATVELGRLALGHCLFRINIEDLHEAQPIVDRDAVLVADLRLDNREELAATLGIADGDLATMPDSEVLLCAWRRWGDDCAEHLLGDFAFAIWDRAKRTLLLGRDHMGQRVIVYHIGEGFVAFATDLTGLFAAEGVPRRINEDELARRLLMSTERIEGELIFQDIRPLPGGTTLSVSGDGVPVARRYWEPRPGAEHLGRDDAHYLTAYRSTVTEAVACRVRRLIDPPALLFSGGFDSGLIAALAGPIVAARGHSLTCLTSVLPVGDTRRSARHAAEAFRGKPGLDLQFYERGTDNAYDDLEASFAAMNRIVPPSIVRRRIGAMAKAAGARLILDGHGGDYTVNGYAPQLLGLILRRGEIRRFVREFRARMRFTGWSARRVFGRDVLGALVPQIVRQWWRIAVNGFSPAWRRRGVNPDFARAAFARGAVDPAQLRDGVWPGARWRARWLEFCTRAAQGGGGNDYAAMVADLDLARPFHDKRIVELGCALPDHLLFRDGRERWLARRAFADVLPPGLIARMPGNDREQPDMLVMITQAMPQMLAALDANADDSAYSRYLDLPALKKLAAAGVSEERLSERIRLTFAMRALTTARFLAWQNRSNSPVSRDQEP
jgi:asparagine synthase (glutamine-hydrolysing)